MAARLTPAQRQEVVDMLRSGKPVYQVAAIAGRSQKTVQRIREVEGIPALPRGTQGVPDPIPVDEPEESGVGAGNPWTPPDGYDVHAERPDQARWLAMLSVASPWERDRLRSSMCKVLGMSPICSDVDLTRALIADRRTAEELAGLYVEARAAMRKGLAA